MHNTWRQKSPSPSFASAMRRRASGWSFAFVEKGNNMWVHLGHDVEAEFLYINKWILINYNAIPILFLHLLYVKHGQVGDIGSYTTIPPFFPISSMRNELTRIGFTEKLHWR